MYLLKLKIIHLKGPFPRDAGKGNLDFPEASFFIGDFMLQPEMLYLLVADISLPLVRTFVLLLE